MKKKKFNIKKTIILTTLSLMILAIFIFRQDILKLDDTLVLVGGGIIIVAMAIGSGFYFQSECKKIGITDIPLSKKDYIIFAIYIFYPLTALILAIIGMEAISTWMGFFGFTTLGIYTLYFSKKFISEGRMQTIFGYYDKKKNYKAFIIMNVVWIMMGILEIVFGIFLLTGLL